MLTDYHVHTAFSDDSLYPMESVVRDAIALGLREICFTDHVDYGIKRDWDDPRGITYRPGDADEPPLMPVVNVDYPRYSAEFHRLKAAYHQQITLKMGLEFGIQTHTIPQYQTLFSQYPLDFILLSIHQIGDQELWNQNYQKNRPRQRCYLGYYEELLAVIQNFRNYSVLAHLDLVSRYDSLGPYSFSYLRPILTEILKTAISDGKGIEVNTSSHRYHLPDLTPSRDILKLYRDLGGRILTLGSDSHKPAHLGAYIEETIAELSTLGFREFCTFDRMEPIFHPLPFSV